MLMCSCSMPHFRADPTRRTTSDAQVDLSCSPIAPACRANQPAPCTTVLPRHVPVINFDMQITWHVTHEKPRRAADGRYTRAGTHVLHLPFQGNTFHPKTKVNQIQPPPRPDLDPMGRTLFWYRLYRYHTKSSLTLA